ncbi:putative carboxylesterase [Helianthus anomalus]
MYICPGSSGVDDVRINPAMDPRLLEKIVCGKVQVCVGGVDKYRERGLRYYEVLKESGWGGDVDIMESEGKGHVFHLTEPDCEEANKLITLLACFFNR